MIYGSVTIERILTKAKTQLINNDRDVNFYLT